ncbi:MAG: hypothetical protein KKB37_03995 [Alphaproteobacteria bacterium]|nr:hypothetical protein [Alphaproteobacteria bacterium]
MAKVWGSGLTPHGVLALADDYRLAGDVIGRENRLAEANPRRLLYLHALETYLRAFLCLKEHAPEEIRKFNHDIEAMLTQCEADGLKVKLQSRRFIEAVAAAGDYVRVRYDIDLEYRGETWPPPPRPNVSMKRLLDSVDDIAGAVSAAIGVSLVQGSTAPADAGSRSCPNAPQYPI